MAHRTRTEDPLYRKNRADLRRKRLPCWLCGKPIRYDLKAPEPLSFSADHVDPVANGGHNHGELRAAHLGCNKQRGRKSREATAILRTSREW
jgi:5-methylcytosine-specific restriction endonuclease McrA